MTANYSLPTSKPEKSTPEIVHKIPGRIRLRVDRLSWDRSYQNRLERSLLKTPAITELKFNKFAACVTILYEGSVTEPLILEYATRAIELAEREDTGEAIDGGDKDDTLLPAAAMVVALIGIPLELPLFVTGGLIIAASLPLWQRVAASMSERREINIDTLDILWLGAQLAAGNHLAGAAALNLSTISENLRRDRLEKLGNELYILFEEEEEKIHWLSNRESFVPIQPGEGDRWLESVEDTELIRAVKPIAGGAVIPTLLGSAGVALLTGDITRASALLPLDLGVSLRGVTPLAVVSALTVAARSAVYIRDGKTLEKLARVDTLIFSVNGFLSLIFGKQSIVPFETTIEALHERGLSLYVIVDTPEDEELIGELINVVDEVLIVKDREELKGAIDRFTSLGKRVAWVDDRTGDTLTIDGADVTVTLAREGYETSANVILHHHELRGLLGAIDLARETMNRVYGSLAIATLPNLIAVGVGVIWGLDPLIAVIINGGSALWAELNSSATRG